MSGNEAGASAGGRGPNEDNLALPDETLRKLPERVRERIQAARKVVEAAPSSSAAVCALGALYLGQNLLDPAAACFRRAAEIIPNSSAPPYFLGITLSQSGDEIGAMREFARSAAIDPNYMPARIRQAEIQYKIDKAKAAELYLDAAKVLPEAPFPHFRLGICLLAVGKSADAEKELLKAVELQPDFGDAHRALAEFYKNENKADLAAKHKDLAAKGGPGRGFSDPLYTDLLEVGQGAPFMVARAKALAAKGEIEAALALLRRAAAEDPEDMQSVAAQANIQDAIGNFNEASELWERVYGHDPKWPDAAARLALSYSKSGRRSQAVHLLKSHLKQQPDDVEARHGLALQLAGNYEFDAALAEEVQVSMARGVTAPSLCQMAHVLIKCEKFEEAAGKLDQAASLDPALVDIHFYRALMHAAAGDADKAFEEYDLLLKRNPSSIDGYAECAQLAAIRRDWARQLRILKAGIEARPNVPALKSMLAHLLATCPDATIRNGHEAVTLAEEVCTATGMRVHAYLDILGEACAENGEFDRALRSAEQAIDIAGRERKLETVKQYEAKRAMYKNGKPFHEKTGSPTSRP